MNHAGESLNLVRTFGTVTPFRVSDYPTDDSVFWVILIKSRISVNLLLLFFGEFTVVQMHWFYKTITPKQ